MPKENFDHLDKLPEYSVPAAPSWSDFTQNTTFHGIKYIFGSNGSSSRR